MAMVGTYSCETDYLGSRQELISNTRSPYCCSAIHLRSAVTNYNICGDLGY
jgi:hypothetical protein